MEHFKFYIPEYLRLPDYPKFDFMPSLLHFR